MIIKRSIYEKLKEHLKKKEITFIVGPRQAGKTTIMLLLKKFLEKNGEKTLFLNLDIEHDKEFFASQDRLIQKIRLELGVKRRGYVFIDEIQRKENAGLFLKGIYDMNLPYKFIVSGSGSIELKERITESLMGRKRVFELLPLSFEEFVNYRTDYKYEDKLYDFFSIETSKTFELMEEYLNFGGYPRVVLEDEYEEKLAVMNEIYRSYIERDITVLLKVKKTELFENLVKLISSQIGRPLNFSGLSSTLGGSVKTIKDYLWYMEKTFVIKRLSPYFNNIRKEIKKSPVYYFYDNGLRNYACGEFGNLRDKGFLFQNFIFNILREKISPMATIHFWRTKDKAEVDFVIKKGNHLLPVEVKYRNLKNPVIPRSLKSFITRYKPESSIIVNLSLKEKIVMNGTRIYIIPFYELFNKRIEKML